MKNCFTFKDFSIENTTFDKNWSFLVGVNKYTSIKKLQIYFFFNNFSGRKNPDEGM